MTRHRTTGGAPEADRLARLLRWAVRLTALALAMSLLPSGWAETASRGGVGVLLSAPYAATLAAALLYARRRSWTNAALSALLLALLLVGLWLGTGQAG